MERNTELLDEYLADWPKQYYELSPNKRLAALNAQIRKSPDSTDDLRRNEIFQKRYDPSFKDLLLQAWMMLKAADAQPSGFFMKRKFEQDVRYEFARLCISTDAEPDPILLEEWTNFADSLIRMYLSSPSYRAAVFGMGAVNERNTALRLATEIETVTKTVPERASLQAAVQPFRAVVLERFCKLVPDGEAILHEVQSR